MKLIKGLQVFILLVGLCQAHQTSSSSGHGSSAQESGRVPASHLRMLSLGLAHLLQGVDENVQRLEKQGERMAAELGEPTKSLERLHKQNVQTGRAHRQVRKDLQILSARKERLWRSVRDLQKELEELETQQGTMRQRMNRMLERVKRLTEPRSAGPTQLDMSSIKVLIDKQARRLSSLTSEVSAQDRMINRRLQHIKRLEKQLSTGVREPPSSAEGTFSP